MTADHSDAQAYRPWRQIARRKSRQIKVGNVLVGGDAPITVQIHDQYADHGRQSDNRANPRGLKKQAPISCAFPVPMKNRPRR